MTLFDHLPSPRLRVLVACEFSGAVRDAFAALGHDAWSCDILPTEAPGQHITGDVRAVLSCGWDLLVAHPPCTYLCNSGVRWLFNGKGETCPNCAGDGGASVRGVCVPCRGTGLVVDKARWSEMIAARDFFLELLHAPIPRIAIENPIAHSHSWLPPHSQVIQPWQFGHGETKATCLWLDGLPPLQPTRIVPGREGRVHNEPPGPDRWARRSRTFPGIARAMAMQWGGRVAADAALRGEAASEVVA